jgi:hypothetical protein
MPMPTSPLAQLGAFRDQLHACFSRRADALFELGDALLCAPVVPSLPHLSLEPVHHRDTSTELQCSHYSSRTGGSAAASRGQQPSQRATCASTDPGQFVSPDDATLLGRWSRAASAAPCRAALGREPLPPLHRRWQASRSLRTDLALGLPRPHHRRREPHRGTGRHGASPLPEAPNEDHRQASRLGMGTLSAQSSLSLTRTCAGPGAPRDQPPTLTYSFNRKKASMAAAIRYGVPGRHGPRHRGPTL